MDVDTAPQTQEHEPKAPPPASAKPPRRLRRWLWRLTKWTVLLLVIAILLVRPFLPSIIRWYVIRTINNTVVYTAKLDDIDVHLWRGAYSVRNIRIIKTTGNIPVPLFSAARLDLGVQWSALLHGRVVATLEVDQPELNFVDAKSDADGQSGAGGPWLEIIRDLFPFKFNAVQIRDASIHFRTYKTPTPVDVYLDQLNATVDDLSNIRNQVDPLVTTVKAKGQAMGQADFEFQMQLDPFSYNPTFHLTTRLLGLDVTKINDLARAYGDFDFKKGWFDLVVEVDAREGIAQGYIKPLFRDLQVFDLVQDVKHDDPLQAFWTAILGITTEVLKNQTRDQFGTLIPFTGDLTSPRTDLLATIGNVLENAFIRAYLPKLQNPGADAGVLQFEPPKIGDPMSVGDQ